ncbi:MAG: tRNA pseudouridine(55) synthase TruB [Elusimicrobiota bacterium]
MHGIVIANKPQGISSYDVVRKIKKLAGESKVGHGGTLDPAASGVLIVLIGEACKISRLFLSARKTYEGKICLGISSSTGDSAGDLKKGGEDNFPESKIKKILAGFKGEYIHRVPQYSSKKYKGKAFYSIKRKGGIPPAREQKSEIYSIKLISYKKPHINFQAEVSSGTYMRTLAEDISGELGTSGYLKALTRIKVGAFDIKMSAPPEEDKWKKGFVPLADALKKYPHVVVDHSASEKISQGINFSPLNIIKKTDEKISGIFAVFSPENKLKALAEETNSGGYNLKRVFNFENKKA